MQSLGDRWALPSARRTGQLGGCRERWRRGGLHLQGLAGLGCLPAQLWGHGKPREEFRAGLAGEVTSSDATHSPGAPQNWGSPSCGLTSGPHAVLSQMQMRGGKRLRGD